MATTKTGATVEDRPAAKTVGAPRVVPFSDGQTHGYIGEVHPDKNRDDYTVTGDEPAPSSVDDRSGWAPVQR